MPVGTRKSSETLYPPGPLSRILMEHPMSGPLREQFAKLRRASNNRNYALTKMKPYRLQIKDSILEVEHIFNGEAPTDISINPALQSLTIARFIMADPEIWAGETFTLTGGRYPRFTTKIEIILPAKVAEMLADGMVGRKLRNAVDIAGTALDHLGDLLITETRVRAIASTLHIMLDTREWTKALTAAQQIHESGRTRAIEEREHGGRRPRPRSK